MTRRLGFRTGVCRHGIIFERIMTSLPLSVLQVVLAIRIVEAEHG